MAKEAYKNHQVGSALGEIHRSFDEGGEEAAYKKAEKLGIERVTVRGALSLWRRKIFSRTAPKKGGKKSKAKKVAKVARKGAKTAKVARAPRKVAKAKKAARKARPVAKVARAARPAKKATGESATA